MSLEQKINYQLNKYPHLKKIVKRMYQVGMYSVSNKIKSEGNILRVSPDDKNNEYFFGYYDKSPWDITDRYMLCLKASNTWKEVSPHEKADILLIDTFKDESDPERVKKIAETNAWNVQQSCMLQWLGPDYRNKILYNDFRKDKYVSVILSLDTMEEKVIPKAIYSVSADGKFALTLDFSRLYELRPGYGYYNVPEITKGVGLPNSTAIWSVNLETGQVQSVLKYTDFANFQPRPEMQESRSIHKVNHIMISPNGKRFMVLYRWFCGQRKYTRLITCNVDGTDMYLLSDDDMVSHCYWKNDYYILAFENKVNTGPGYYLMKDKTNKYTRCWPNLSNDGHPSYSPNGKLIVTDSYPNRARISCIKLMDGDEKRNNCMTIARVFSPFKYDNDTRCDLHPRWNHAGDKICFDGVFEGYRSLYVVNINEKCFEKKKYRVLYVFTSCKRSGPVQIMYNLIANMDRNLFEPILITLYDEENDQSDLKKFLDLGLIHYHISLDKKSIILNKTKKLKRKILSLNPDIIHSLGVFPDYAISKMKFNNQVITLHNYMHDDYLAKFGKFQGSILEFFQMQAIKRAAKVWTCSKSLADLYNLNKKLHFDYIRNGVDVERFSKIGSLDEKDVLREKLNLPKNKIIFVYTGQFIDRKNQEFLINLFSKEEKLKKYCLLLLGEGMNFEKLKTTYGQGKNIIYKGNVENVEDYLRASDYYVSSSRSEGLPTGVLEAMSCGLPVLLSDILQHREIFDLNENIGVTYQLDDYSDFLKKFEVFIANDYVLMSNSAFLCAHGPLSSKTMSKNYQEEYLKIIKQIGRDI